MEIGAGRRLSIIKVMLWVESAVLLIWWPIMHWLFSDFYHGLLGFAPGTYPQPMVDMIGACGLCIVTFSLLAARNPGKNRDMVIGLVACSFILAITYAYLIGLGYFPVPELFNLGLSAATGTAIAVIYPWKEKILTRVKEY